MKKENLEAKMEEEAEGGRKGRTRVETE